MNRLALVTGAARGIGREVALELRARGYRVVASGRDAEGLRALRGDGGDDLLETAVVDLDSTLVQTQVRTAIAGRPLDLLVLNAARFAPWDETVATADLSEARAILETNLFGTWAVVQAALPALRAHGGGVIIGVGSGAGSHGDPQFGLTTNPGAASYAVSKAALHAMLHKLAGEVASDGIEVNVTDPGLTATTPGMEDFGARPVREGALSVLAPLDAGAPGGTFTRDGRTLPW